MELLRKVSNFGASWDDLKNIYILFVRSHLEQSCTVWHSGLTEENSNDLERVQKSALKLILKNSYETYENALKILQLDSLKQRRKILCLDFSKKCLEHPKMKDLFPKNPKSHQMTTVHQEKYFINHAHKERTKNSPIIYMQRLLNEKSF